MIITEGLIVFILVVALSMLLWAMFDKGTL